MVLAAGRRARQALSASWCHPLARPASLHAKAPNKPEKQKIWPVNNKSMSTHRDLPNTSTKNKISFQLKEQYIHKSWSSGFNY